ncbi:testis-specific gene A8 protein-like, partial [Astyanax mexicanus]|uniref:testis-specific gene A8 protein-like n=1 Tax=Astyanax mexicanus TaxID=7994 RepID=UPI0020CAB4F0
MDFAAPSFSTAHVSLAATALSSPAAAAPASPTAADPASSAAAQPRSDALDSSGESAAPVRVFEAPRAAADLRSKVSMATALHSTAPAAPEPEYAAVKSSQVSVLSSAAQVSTQTPTAQGSKFVHVSVPVPAVPTANV